MPLTPNSFSKVLGFPAEEVREIVLDLLCVQFLNLSIDKLALRPVFGQFLFIDRAGILENMNISVHEQGHEIT